MKLSKSLKTRVEKESSCHIKMIRSDRGKEYTSKEFDKFYEDESLEHQLTVGYTPKHNGVSGKKK